jgi:uncharacterized protein (DUF58 family)
LPNEVFAGRSALIEVELRNTSRLFPAYGLVVRDSVGRRLFLEKLLPTSTVSQHTVEVEFDQRGWRHVGPWQLEVLLPLGFFLKSKVLLPDEKVLVFPRLLRSSTVDARRGGGSRSADTLTGRGREGEVIQLRDYRDGDDRRQLHWKQTARQQRPIVVERQQRAERPVILVVDPRVANPGDPSVRHRFEHMISDVATGVVRRLERGAAVGLVVGRVVIPPVRTASRAYLLLRPLAEVRPLPASAPPPALRGQQADVSFRVEDSV